jgi:hypothetical protein
MLNLYFSLVINTYKKKFQISKTFVIIPPHNKVYLYLSESPQYYCGEIRQKLTLLISLYCSKTYHRPDHPIHIFIITRYYYHP